MRVDAGLVWKETGHRRVCRFRRQILCRKQGQELKSRSFDSRCHRKRLNSYFLDTIRSVFPRSHRVEEFTIVMVISTKDDRGSCAFQHKFRCLPTKETLISSANATANITLLSKRPTGSRIRPGQRNVGKENGWIITWLHYLPPT